MENEGTYSMFRPLYSKYEEDHKMKEEKRERQKKYFRLRKLKRNDMKKY